MSATTDSANSWTRPWSAEEIVGNASNWSLAGDAGILNYLESFSQELLGQAEETTGNLDKLLADLDSAQLSLDIAKNEFSSLHNLQFMESRVYEEDETLMVVEAPENVQNEKPSEENRIADMKEAVLRGIEVVDKYFEKVEIPASDSEDETDFPNFVLRPKDLYIDRPLPYVIGSDDWYKKWHVGLLDSSSESEEENASDKFSDSDSESDLPVINRSHIRGASNSGSEADLLNRGNSNPVANSTFDESIKPPILPESSDSEDYSSAPAQAPISSKNFAQELAAKLGNVIEQSIHDAEPEVNKRPIQNTVGSRTIGNLFSDEPPPIDDDDEAIFGSSSQQGIFSGRGGLFDDLEESVDLWKDKKVQQQSHKEVTKSKLPNLFDDDDDIFIGKDHQAKSTSITDNISSRTSSKNITSDLFDDDNSSEDDLFTQKVKSEPKKSLLPSVSKSVMPYYEEQPPELQPKKPIGGVKVLDADLFSQKPTANSRRISSENVENENKPETTVEKSFSESKTLGFIENEMAKKEQPQVVSSKKSEDSISQSLKPKPLSLFDDDYDKDLFEDDLFSNISTKKFTSDLFDEEPPEDRTDLLSTPQSEKSSTSIEQKSKLYVETQSAPDITVPLPKQPTKKAISLFDPESEDEVDDLFAANMSAKSQVVSILEHKIESPEQSMDKSSFKDVQHSEVKEPSHVGGISFLHQAPPDDDDWDAKSETNIFEENYSSLFDNTSEVNSQRSGLFDSEPPSLFYESSGIVRDISNRVETDDSFNPYASSSRRFSTDIFSEQQSNDSFFVTKNKSESNMQAIYSNLESIQEISNAEMEGTTCSNTEITPSGNLDDLLASSTDSVFERNATRLNDAVEEEGEDLLQTPKSNLIEVEKQSEVKAATKPTVAPRTSLLVVKSEKTEPVDNDNEPAPPVLPKVESPGKLRHNLNINVHALLPGASLPKRDSSNQVVRTSDELPSTNINSADKVSPDLPPDSPIENKQEREVVKRTGISKSVSFEDPLESTGILPSITKDRAKISVKRRPSSRRARQESIRKSGTDFKINPADCDSKHEHEDTVTGSDLVKQEDVGLVVEQTDDIFAQSKIGSIPQNAKPKEEHSTIKQSFLKEIGSEKPDSLFSSPDSESPLFADLDIMKQQEDFIKDDLSKKFSEQNPSKIIRSLESGSSLFADLDVEHQQKTVTESLSKNVGKESPLQTNLEPSLQLDKPDLFDDLEDFDDIFSSKKLPPKSRILKRSLFDDEFDDDDIFGSSNSSGLHTAAKKEETKVPEKKGSKAVHVKKLENTEVEDDPLSSFVE